MDYRLFYAQLFRPLEAAFGRIDPETRMAIIGFDCGGPLNFATIDRKINEPFVTYISCELAVREAQVPSEAGRFELFCHSNDEQWVRAVVSEIGRMSLEAEFGHGHTVDVSALVGEGAPLTGAVLEQFATAQVEAAQYCLLRVHGITAAEMNFAVEEGSDVLFERLKRAGIYPRTDILRGSLLQ